MSLTVIHANAQMIEDIQNQRQPPAQGTETSMYIHSKAVSDDQVHYHCQKSSLQNATSSSQPLDGEPKALRGGRYLS